MKTKYLGLELSSPVIVGSSPYTSTVSGLVRCAENGAGAAVLKSIFEEQILHHAASLGRQSESYYGDAELYLQRYLGDNYKAEFLQLLSDARAKCSMPLIASINCVGLDGEWVDYATLMAQAGASALELNIFLQPTDIHTSSQELERRYAEIAGKVASAVRVPVSVKLSMRFTNLFAVADSLEARGVKGVVLFNRFFEPDIDVERMQFIESSPYSEPSELRNVLRTAAICSTVLPKLDLSVSTGVHDGEAVVKALLCGARSVQVCSALHRGGYEVVARMNEYLDAWASRHGFFSLEEFRGRLKFGDDTAAMAQRVQYMKYFPASAE